MGPDFDSGIDSFSEPSIAIALMGRNCTSKREFDARRERWDHPSFTDMETDAGNLKPSATRRGKHYEIVAAPPCYS